MYATPCAAIAAAGPGETIEVMAGSYDGDHCSWTTDNLTIRAVGTGRAKIDAGKSGANIQEDKGIFVIYAPNATIEGFEFVGATATQMNGAGIRHQGTNLVVTNCYFHDNQDGLLGAPGTANTGEVTIQNSEFSSNGAGDGQSHNMYLGNYAKFTLIGSYSHGANVGHLLKSRALENDIFANRLTDEEGTTASYEINLPNGGLSYIIGNLIEQSAASQNGGIIDHASEGMNPDNHLFVVNNTIVNDKGSGTFVQTTVTEPAVIMNNILTGGGTVTNQSAAVLTTNFTDGDPMLVDAASYDYHLRAGSPCRDMGTDPTGMEIPTLQYESPLQAVTRTSVGKIDIGAYEFGNTPPADSGAPDGGGASTTRADSGTDGATSNDSSDSGGCSCTLSRSSPPTPAGLLLALAWLITRRRRASR